MAKIKIRIDQQGNTHFEVEGVEGPSCEQVTEALVRAMGGADEFTEKEEYVQELPDYIENMEG